jgi:nucleoside-diphosphate-sugar epimerase
MSTPRHVIFGTGAIGLATLDALRRRGERVRLVNRSGTAPVPDDIEVLGGDASDPAFTTTTAAANGAQVVYQPSIRPTTNGSSCSRPSRPACWQPPRPPGPGWSAWKTSTCTAAPTASP